MLIIREKNVRSNDEMKHEISISHQLEILLKRHVKHTPTKKIEGKNFLFIEPRLECPSLLDTLRSSARLVGCDLFFSFVCSCAEFDDCFLALFFSKGSEDIWSLLSADAAVACCVRSRLLKQFLLPFCFLKNILKGKNEWKHGDQKMSYAINKL